MLYIGIDIGKSNHVAALLTPEQGTHYSTCPIIKIDQSRAGFVALLQAIESYRTRNVFALVERTGHYGQALEQFLQEHDISVYRIVAQARYGKNKTDKHDARALAATLYSQLHLRAPVVNERERITRLVPASVAARSLRSHVHRRNDLVSESTQRKNQLTAIADELFPELATIYKDISTSSCLALRERFPTPQAIATATLDDLCATRLRHLPQRSDLARLQELAGSTIGTRDTVRRDALALEQDQLLQELRLLTLHVGKLDSEITTIIEASREGQIMTSFPGIGPISAAILLSGIGSIANFPSSAHLRGYLGWSPKSTQTGTSRDSTSLDRGGNALLKRTMYLVSLGAIHHDPSWKALYQRLVHQKCAYDSRTKRYTGKMKVIGRIAGQITGVLYTLLKKDYLLMQSIAPGQAIPPPELYRAEKHVSGLRKAGEFHGL